MNEHYDKRKLAAKIAHDYNMPKGQADRMIAIVRDSIVDILKNGDDCKIVGLVNFQWMTTAAHLAGDPNTHELMVIPSVTKIKAKISEKLRKDLQIVTED